ncbi:DUF2339 domain-containing protein [Flavobacterium sp.]
MTFLLFVFAICIVILFINLFNLKNETNFLKMVVKRHTEENDSLKNEIELIKKSFQGKQIDAETLIPPIGNPEAAETIEVTKSEEVPEENQPYFIPITDEDLPKEPLVEIPEPIQETADIPIMAFESHPLPVYERQKEIPATEPVYQESAFSIFIKKAEKQFADNWTGILGTAIMVLGIGYLSIYTALKVEPFYRILILWAYAGLLIGSYYLLKKNEKWEKTRLWLRSAGASLFLFGCFGASQIPALKFVTNDILGYSLIGIGIALNLFVGYIIRQQTFLSLHVVLSMLVLCVIPEKTLATILMAATTSAIGILLSYKEKWEYHLLVVIVAFVIFDIWFNAQGNKLTATENIFAIMGIIAVAGSCMLMQYRSVYENKRFDKAGFLTHLVNWSLFATGLILHSTGNRFKTFILMGGAVVCFFIALRARKKNVFWLYHLDGMVSFVLGSLSIIMLNEWNIGIDIISCILYLLTIVCLFVVYKEKEALLHRIFLGINHVVGIALLIFGLLLISNSLPAEKITNAYFSTILLSLIAMSIPVISSVRKEFNLIDAFIPEKSLSLNGILAIIFSVFVVLKSDDVLVNNSFYYVLIGIAVLWTFLKKKFSNVSFDIGRIAFFVLAVFLGGFLLHIQEKSYSDWTFLAGLFCVCTFNWSEKLFYKNEFIIRFLAILGVNAAFFVVTYKYLHGYPLARIFGLFAIGLLNHEFLWINFKKKSLTTDNQSFLYFFYYLFAVIGSVLLLWTANWKTSTETALAYLGISSVEIYVLFAKRIKNKSNEAILEWGNFNLLNSEFLIFNALVFGFSCLRTEFVSVYTTVLAVIAFVAFQKLTEFRRYNLYSFAFLALGIALTLYDALDNLGSADKKLTYITQAICVFVSIGYTYLQSKSEDKKTQELNSILPYIQNAWIIALLVIQVPTAYLPVLCMVLAFTNFWFIDSGRIKIRFHSAPLIALLGIFFSVFYSFDKLNGFTALDWILQLGSVIIGLGLTILLNKKETLESLKSTYQIALNVWLSLITFSQLEHKWLPIYWAAIAIVNLYLYNKKINKEKNISIIYYFLANLHLGFLSFNFYESKFLAVYLAIFVLLAVYIYLAYKWLEEYSVRNSLLIYPATLSIGCFLYLTFDKGILTFFWILEALGLLILGIMLKEKYFRYVSLSLVGLCVVRLMFFDLSNTNFLIRALVLLGVGVVLIIMNSLFKKYKDRFD